MRVSARMRKILGGEDANGFIYNMQCDLPNLKQIAVAVFVSLFSTFKRQVLTGTALHTNSCGHARAKAL